MLPRGDRRGSWADAAARGSAAVGRYCHAGIGGDRGPMLPRGDRRPWADAAEPEPEPEPMGGEPGGAGQ